MSHTQPDLAASGPLANRAEPIAGLVHDLGNLIQIASAAVSILARDPTIRTAGLDPVLAGATTSLERAGALVRRTIGVASGRAAAVRAVTLAACLGEVEKLIGLAWDRSIALDIQIDADLPAVTCDPLALQNVLLNLLFNARDAMPTGGTISIRAATAALDFGETIELRVSDTGIGMTPETVARAFDPFFTTKAGGMGGVGLSMVARFVQDAGGRIFIESKYGFGTTVTLQLPVT
jgi:signal transduction histidine kinase